MTKIHPLPNKRNLGRQKKLRRLPHIFEKVLELPLGSNANVDVQESPESFRFCAAADGLGEEIRTEAIQIFPGVTKVVIRGESVIVDDGLEIDLWRFRLPECTRPDMASAAYMGGELVVVVPKDDGLIDYDDGGETWGAEGHHDHLLHVLGAQGFA
uniref:Uncharacterized protein n=1 Tax=Kalanchoe fedtschenkoi TaxID=63787 RepID=A0A7N0U0H6_KALFE